MNDDKKTETLTEDEREVLLELCALRGELEITVNLNEKLRGENAKLQAMLKKYRWTGDYIVNPEGEHYRGCIECGGAEVEIIDGEMSYGDCTPDCELAKLLEEG